MNWFKKLFSSAPPTPINIGLATVTAITDDGTVVIFKIKGQWWKGLGSDVIISAKESVQSWHYNNRISGVLCTLEGKHIPLNRVKEYNVVYEDLFITP